MKQRAGLMLAWLIFFTCVFSGGSVYADTDGTELQILDPSQLEIQLGPEWAGTEFQFRTDMGIYPTPIYVDEHGFLRLEIGGSKTYTLSMVSLETLTDRPANDTTSTISEETITTTSFSMPFWERAGIFFMGLLLGFGLSYFVRRHSDLFKRTSD